MDEFTVLARARAFVRKANATGPSAPIDAYLKEANARVKRDKSMGPDEAGSSFEMNGSHFISVNGNDKPERQNFTVCHELAHIILGLPSEHDAPWWSYARRSPNEVACDVFAAELLLPYHSSKPFADAAQFGFKAINQLAGQFTASLTATGSRFAAVVDAPCAFILAEQGRVRYAARSAPLREAKVWIRPGSSLPSGSLSEKLRAGAAYAGPEQIAADRWFEDWARGGELLEDAQYFPSWDQTLALIWFDSVNLMVSCPGPGRRSAGEGPLALPRRLNRTDEGDDHPATLEPPTV